MKESEFDSDLLEQVPYVHRERNYWMVRTSSGNNYDNFINGNYIAIGWNEVTVSDLHQLNNAENSENLFDQIKKKIIPDSTTDSSEGNRGVESYQSRSLNQLLKFAYEIKRGDIVVIPSYNSDDLAFGEVVSTPVLLSDTLTFPGDTCSFYKRKRVRWLKRNVSRYSLEANLYKFIFAHQTINNISEYALYINNFLFDFYQIDNKYTLVLRLRSERAIGIKSMEELYSDLVYFIDYFKPEENNDSDSEVTVKFDLQSPGTIVFVAGALAGFALFAVAVLTILAGGKASFEIDPKTKKINWGFESKSLLDKLSNYLDRKQIRKQRAQLFDQAEDAAKLARLIENLQQFQVDQNKEVKELTESEFDEKDQ